MSETGKHTSGPWHVEYPFTTGYVRIIGNLDGDANDDGSTRVTYTHICDVMDNSDEEANAALIASAPDMADEIARLRADLASARAEVERLRVDCAEAYQAAGVLADTLGYWRKDTPAGLHPPLTKLLDNLSAAADGQPRPHADLLPFVTARAALQQEPGT